MKELEKLLFNTPKPEITLTLFRQNLRRSLLNSGRYARDGYKTHGVLFFAPTALAISLVVILVLFVMNPKIPSNFHNSISPDRVSMSSRQVEVQQNENENGAINGNLANLVEQLYQSTEVDLDKAFVSYLAEDQHQFEPEAIQPIGETRLLAVKQYQLNNGQRVLIYTPIPTEQISYVGAY